MIRSGTWILLASLTVTPATAQEAGSFSELSRLVEAGEDVRVTLSGGRELKAKVDGVTLDTSLSSTAGLAATSAKRTSGPSPIVTRTPTRTEPGSASGPLRRTGYSSS